MRSMIHVVLNKTKTGGIALAAAAAAALALTGCGGGGSDAPSAMTLNGTAAVGVPISGAIVNVVCAAGPALTGIPNTSTTGAWSVNVSGQTLPCAVQITGGTINGSTNATAYQSIATRIGTVNVTPLTTLLVANLAGTTTPSTWFTGLTGAQLNAITAARVTTALGNLRTALGLTALNGIDPITLAFNPTSGVVMDDILTALASAITSNASSYTSLLNLAGASAGAGFTTAGVNTALTTAYANTSSGGSGGTSSGGIIPTCIANNYSHGVSAAQLSPFVRSYSGNLYASNAPGTPAGAAVNLSIAADGGITYNAVLQPVTSICQDNTNAAQIYVQFLGGRTLSGLDFFTDGGVTGNLADANLTMVQGGSCGTVGGCGSGATGGGTTSPTASGGGTLIVSGLTPTTGNGNFALPIALETSAGGSSTAKRVEFTDATPATRTLRLYYQPSTGVLENIQYASPEKSFNCFVGDPMFPCDTAKITFSASGKSILLNLAEFKSGATVNGVLEGLLKW